MVAAEAGRNPKQGFIGWDSWARPHDTVASKGPSRGKPTCRLHSEGPRLRGAVVVPSVLCSHDIPSSLAALCRPASACRQPPLATGPHFLRGDRRQPETPAGLEQPTAALTFDPHPARILRPDAAPAALSTPDRRAGLLLDLGVDAVLVQPVDRAFLALPAAAFYREVLRGAVGAAAIVEGPDFRFGANRQGDLALLGSLATEDGVELITVAPLERGGEAVSSSRIRRLVSAGEIEAASSLLTAPYRLEGLVVHGQARGRTLGFPTANLEEIATLLPAAGVYAGLASPACSASGAGGESKSSWPAAIHIGPNVSFGATGVTVEVHCIGFDGDLYGQRLDVDFLARLRDTRRFDSLDDLKAQLATDVARAAAVAAASRAPGERAGG